MKTPDLKTALESFERSMVINDGVPTVFEIDQFRSAAHRGLAELAAIKAQRDELLAALVGLADFANGKLGQNPYSIPQFKAACVAACHAVGYPTEGKTDKGAWMDGIDNARALLSKLEGGGK